MGFCFSKEGESPHEGAILCCGGDEPQKKHSFFTNNITQSKARKYKALKEAKDARQRELAIKIHSGKKIRHERIAAKTMDVEDESFILPSHTKTDDISRLISSSLSNHFIFDDLSPASLRHFIDAMEPYEAPAGTIIIKEGDIGDYFYVLQEGTVDIIVSAPMSPSNNAEKNGYSCTKGTCFGEIALLYDCPRSATVKSSCDCTLYRIDQRTFRHLLAKDSSHETQDCLDIVNKVPLLSELDDRTKAKLVNSLTMQRFPEGKKIVVKGNVGEVFYIVREGQAKVHDIGQGESQFADAILQPGDFFGERALLTGEPRNANVTALTDCSMLCLSRMDFHKIMGDLTTLMKKGWIIRLLKQLPSLSATALDDSELERLAELLVDVRFDAGHVLEMEGEPLENSGIFIIISGVIKIINDDGVINTLQKNDHFGERTIKLKKDDLSPRTIKVEESCHMKFLSKASLLSVIGSSRRLSDTTQVFKKNALSSLTLNDLEKHGILGEGAFGKVYLVREKTQSSFDDGEQQKRRRRKVYALKEMSKRNILDQNQAVGILREKNILASFNHPLILNLIATFQDRSNVYMITDLVQGGELFGLIQDHENGLPEATAAFYAACIISSITSLHDNFICYRDLKPENVLIDVDGYCILVDFGFAKAVVDKTYTLCGTPEYLAPEIILSRGHNKGVDYWTIGILIYEMLTGASPFYEDGIDQKRMFKAIVKNRVPQHENVTGEVEDIVKSLLMKRWSQRLGCLAHGKEDVMGHGWFKEIDFKLIHKKEIKAPWLPDVTDEMDTSYFGADLGGLGNIWGNDTGPALSHMEQKVFEDF